MSSFDLTPDPSPKGEGRNKQKLKTMATEIHIGHLIELKLKEKRLSKKLLGGMTGIKAVTVRYLLKRETLDVVTLHKIGKALKFNFFSYFPVAEDSTGLMVGSLPAGQAGSEKEKEIDAVKVLHDEEKKKFLEKIAGLEKELDGAKRELVMMKQENGFLKEINELLKRKE